MNLSFIQTWHKNATVVAFEVAQGHGTNDKVASQKATLPRFEIKDF